MPIILSRGCEYALQAVLYLAFQPREVPVHLRDISNALNIPPHFLGKILQLLSRNNLVVSKKGKNGGFLLVRTPKEVVPYDIIEVIDGSAFLDDCILGFPGCGDENPCPVHSQWKQAKQIILEMLKDRSIQELSKEVSSKLDLVQRKQSLSATGTQLSNLRSL